MRKPDLKLAFIATAIVAAAILFFWQREGGRIADASSDGEVANRVAALREEKQSLQQQLDAAIQRSQQPEQRNVELKSEAGDLATPKARADSKRDRMDLTYGEGTAAGGINATRWGYALINYACEHDEQFPMGLRDAVGFLGDDEKTCRMATTMGQYEILYYGRRDEMSNPGETPVLREKQSWQTTDGMWARFYFYGDGVGRIRTSSDESFIDLENSMISKDVRQ
jgi:hypothetical protein